jgi:hypothetical protein
VTWTTFDINDNSTWPPFEALVLAYMNGSHCFLQLCEDDGAFYFRDEHYDYCDGIDTSEPDLDIRWTALPVPA